MPVVVQCTCGRVLKARDEFAGTRAECPTCGAIVQIPSSTAGGVVSAPPESGRAAPTSVHNYLDPPSGVSEASFTCPGSRSDSFCRSVRSSDRGALSTWATAEAGRDSRSAVTGRDLGRGMLAVPAMVPSGLPPSALPLSILPD